MICDDLNRHEYDSGWREYDFWWKSMILDIASMIHDNHEYDFR